MGLSGCMSCLKYLLFVFNFIFWLAGIAILALAIFFRVDASTGNILQADHEQRDLFYAVCYVLMAAGGAIMVVGFCGCCGALQESRMLLSLFAIALFLLLGTEIGAGVYTHFNKESMNCCGYNGPWDYCDLKTIKISNDVLGTISIGAPDILSCTKGGNKNVLDFCPTLESATVGCRQRMLQALEQNLNIVVGVAISIGVVQLLGLVFSIMLCQAIGQDYTSGKLA